MTLHAHEEEMHTPSVCQQQSSMETPVTKASHVATCTHA